MSLFRAFYFSLALHVVLYILMQFTPETWDPPRPQINLTEIDFIDQPFDENVQQIVRQADAPENQQIEDDTTARFLSEKRQRVLLETRAQNSGLTQNRREDRPMPRPQEKPQPKRERDLSGYEPIQLPKANQVITEGPSTIGDVMPNDVAVGSFTALNSDRFQFYSFYSRIEELIRFRWETRVKNAVDSYSPQHVLKHIGFKNWVTHIEFLITPEGHLHQALVMKESGMKPFDLAAVGAFQEARFFPNPPKEMIESDGYIHLKYSFNVYFEPSSFAGQ